MSALTLALFTSLMLQTGGQTPAIVERARVKPGSDVSFHALVLPETVYVGQAVTYELGVFISDEMRQRLRKNPEFVPPDLRSVLAYELRDPRSSSMVVREGRTYEVHVFRRALFPLAPGRIDIPPARLTYTVPQGSSFFSKEDNRLLTSEPTRFFAVAPPAAGRPAKWSSGAVGDMHLTVSASSRGARVGDPFVLTVRVAGAGNVNLWPRPELNIPWASVVSSAERVMIDSLASYVRGAKDFDYLVTPNVDGSLTVPPVSYAYFDPVARGYRVANSASHTLTVNSGGLASVDTVAPVHAVNGVLPLRPSWSSGWPDGPDNALWFWIVFAVVPVPAVARLWRARPRRRAPETPDSALRALKKESSADVARVRAALRNALDARLGKTQIPWADPVALPRSLRHFGITDETIRVAMQLFARIDDAAYGSTRAAIPGIAGSACDLYDDIDREALAAGKGTRAMARAGAAAIVLLAATLFAQNPLTPRGHFDRGVATYAAGAAPSAARDFFRAAHDVPSATVAWANAGTASWTAGDTALAVVGWQRALRLDPLDDETRERLSLVGADAGAGKDTVWPIPRRLPAWIGLILWIAGWIAIWRRRETKIAISAIAAAFVLVAVARVHHMRLAGRDLAIVALPAPLRMLPALGSDAGPTPLTGEMVRVIGRDGVWAEISATGGREGWIDGGRLLSLDAKPLRD